MQLPAQSDKMNGRRLTYQFIVLLLMISSPRWFGFMVVDATRVTLSNNNGYKNLVVAISYETPRAQSEMIIKNTQKMISEASQVLYKATGDRNYFESVHILIPESWDHIKANFSTWETFNTADVIVDTPNPMHKDVPYTQQNGKCGEKGERIHLTPDYVATLFEEQNILHYGNPGKVFVHEWAHYRYGIFDEYGKAGGEYPLFYRKSGSSSIIPNICANNPTMFTLRDITNNATTCKTDPVTNIYDENCRFELRPSFKPVSSLASYHQIDSVVHFCKDDQEHAHMSEAPNKHNTMCGGVSTWTVIMRSPDFADYKNRQNTSNAFGIMPTEFQIVKSIGSRFVAVLDVSGSMEEFDRIGKLGESVRSWIKNDLPSGNELGMIKFSSTADIVSELKIISDPKSREEIMEKVPKDLDVATCIGCGLELAIQMLKEGGIVVLVTDGKNSPGYRNISEVEKDIINAGIRVITVAFGRGADTNIEHLADATGGKSYFIKDDDSSEALQQAFMGACTYQSRVKNNDLIFKLFEKSVAAKELKTNLADTFEVDPTVGRNLKLSVFNLDGEDSVESIELIGSDGNVTNNFKFDTSTATVTVALAQIGTWSMNVNLKNSQTRPVLVTVTTQLRPDVATPIKTECYIRNGADIKNANDKGIIIQAEVWKGTHPVTGAKIKAYVVKPNDELEILELLDNGANADTTQDDGVYSKYYTNATQEGRYTVKCQVKSNHSAFERLGFIGSASPQLFGDDKSIADGKIIPVADFTRIVSGGSFQVKIPVSRNDSYQPGDVTDLSLRLINDTATNISIALKWTAPGDDLDSGTVSHYEIKYSDVVTDVINSYFDNESSIRGRRSIITEYDLIAGSLQPKEAGTQQMATFQLTDIEREKPYYLALRAVDKAEKAGQVSNFVIFFIPDKSVFDMTRKSDEENSEIETDKEIHFHINNKEPNYHVSSVMVATFGLILIVCLCATLLMATVKHTQMYRSYVGISPFQIFPASNL